MQKVLVGLGIGVFIAAILAGVYLWSDRARLAERPAANESAGLSDPMGVSTDPNDPGEQHYKHGRYPEALAYWTAEAA